MKDRNPELTDSEIDRRLGTEDTIIPSSGFAAGVMGRVRAAAAAPPPIPFPWIWALPGLGGIAIGFVAAIGPNAAGTAATAAETSMSAWQSSFFDGLSSAVGLIASAQVPLMLALAVTAGSLMIAAAFVRGRSFFGGPNA